MSNSMQQEVDLCVKHAQFASHMVRWQFKIIYWVMFMVNLVVLFLASWTYTKAHQAMQRYSSGMEPAKRSKRLRLYIFLCLLCVSVSTAIVVMEAYALLALQFCDGEDLMSLYWSTWTMTQLGSLIAMLGIILHLLHSLRDKNHPPWALALGTPVLVIAGILHLFHDFTMSKMKKLRASAKSPSKDELNQGPPMSQANTIQAPDDDDDDDDSQTIHGEFIGFTVEGGPIVRFSNRFGKASLPKESELLGYCEDERPIVAYRKDAIQFIESSKVESIEKGDDSA